MKERVESAAFMPNKMSNLEACKRPQRNQPLPLVNDEGQTKTSPDKWPLSPLSPTLSETSSVSSSSPGPSSKKFARKEKIGQGAQGSVYRCIENATGKEVAVKIIMTHELSPVEVEAIKREVKTIKKLHHRYLVEYYKATEKKSRHLSIYMEFVAGGSLSSKLRHGGALPLDLVQKYTRQLCEALQHLHLNRIAHRDIKCANVFLTSDQEDIKLGDFGAFKELGSVSLVGGLKGTPHWMAPEVIRAEQHTSEDGWFKADIWSLGCAIIEMLTGHSPWQQYSNPLTAMYQIVSSNKTPTIPPDASEETVSFLTLCLQRNPEERASVAELLGHPFVGIKMTSNYAQSASDGQSYHAEKTPYVQANQAETTPSKIKLPRARRPEMANVDDRHEHQSSKSSHGKPAGLTFSKAPLGVPTDQPVSSTAKHSSDGSGLTSATPVRPSLRKPSIHPRLKPLEFIQSPSNQVKESHDHFDRKLASPLMKAIIPISRGSSVGALSGHAPPLGSAHEVLIRPVRLRRLSTAPTLSREPEKILNPTPPHHKHKLPPLSARPASSAKGTESSFLR